MMLTREIHSFYFNINVQETDRAFVVGNALITKHELDKIFPKACDPWEKFQSFLCSLDQLGSLPHDDQQQPLVVRAHQLAERWKAELNIVDYSSQALLREAVMSIPSSSTLAQTA